MLQHSDILFFLVFIINLIFSALVALCLACFIPKKIIQNRSRSLVFLTFTIVGTFIPLGGLLVALWLVFFSRYYYNPGAGLNIENFTVSNYINEKFPASQLYAQGWAQIRLSQQAFSKQERIQALTMINKNVDASVNKINWAMLVDDMEELRLYAFSLIENQRNQLNKTVYKLIQASETAKSATAKANLEKQLAIHYRQMITFNLIEPELKPIIWQKCFDYAEKALKILKEDAQLWCILGHFYFENGDTKNGLTALATANQYKAPTSQTVPAFSEYHFRVKNYHEVKQYLSSDISFWEIPHLNDVVKFWCGSH